MRDYQRETASIILTAVVATIVVAVPMLVILTAVANK